MAGRPGRYRVCRAVALAAGAALGVCGGRELLAFSSSLFTGRQPGVNMQPQSWPATQRRGDIVLRRRSPDGVDASPLRKGDRVQVEYAKVWYDSEILDITEDGSICSVVFDDDGATEQDVDVDTRIRPALPPMRLAEGQRVSVLTEVGWEPAKILTVSLDGSVCSAKFNDGSDEVDIDVRRRVEEPRPQLSSLKVGTKLEGKVKNLVSYGAWVDIGADRNALLPANMITTERLDSVNDFLSVGMQVDVFVQNVRKDGKVAVSMVEGATGQRNADSELFKGYRPDQWITGIVERTPKYGIHVKIPTPDGTGFSVGLVHSSQIRQGYVAHPKNEVDLGAKVKVRVLHVADGKIALSMKKP